MRARPAPALAPARRQRGMSMIEIMVGVLIGLIGCVAIFQVYSVAETRKRTISSGSDTDISGRLGQSAIERDVHLAGYGYGVSASSSEATLGCTVTAYDSARSSTDFTYTLAPVVITQGSSGAPDTITVLRGSSSLMASSKTIDQAGATTLRIKSDTGGRTGVQRGDVVVAVNTSGGLACGMYEITGDANADTLTLDHATGSYTDSGGAAKTAHFNKSGGITFTLTGSGKLYNLGASPVQNVWSVDTATGKLRVANNLVWVDADSNGTNDGAEVADGIADLQAEYGVDANNDGMIASSEWTTTAPTDWKQLLAIRFAILVRGGNYEKSKVTTTAPKWSGGSFTMRNVDGTTDDDPAGANNWRNYRYNVFETVAPLRNILIGKQIS